ncbi:MAG: hypothetical protein HUU35_19920, partial [Armatimonadetes bacterium]|nr:hypothetical protein [Armatimonadota bacterium]
WAPSESLLYSARGEAPNEPERIYRLAPGSDRGQSLSDGPDGETLPAWTPSGKGLVFAELRRSQPRLMVRPLDDRPRALAGAQDGDTEPTVLPGSATRAPHLYVLGRRVFSLPTPRLIEQELLLPLDELARQLSLELKPENDRFLLSSPQHSIIVEPVTGEVAINTAVGPERRGLVPPPQTVAGVVMVPLRQLAELFGLKTSWDAGTRTMRVGG